jgi:MarR family protease production transcriptional regulator HPr
MLDKQTNDYYFNLFLNLSRALYMNLEKDWDAEAQLCGISYAQQHCLWILHVQDGLTLSQLGNIAIWNKSTTSAMVSRLEAKGLVYKKREEHSHEVRVFLTDAGKEKIEASTSTPECIEYMGLFQNKDPQEIEGMLALLQKLYEEVSKNRNEDFNVFINQYSKNLLDLPEGKEQPSNEPEE